MYLMPEDLLKILLAVAAGGLIGLEREFRDKAAGFRTLIFICVGAALFTIFSGYLAGDQDPTRIAANIVSGVVFLGAGVILRDGGRVIGLTTAATIWLTAALGMGIGGGQYGLVAAAVGLALMVLWVFPRIEQWVDNIWEAQTYEVVCALSPDRLMELEALIHTCHLHLRRKRQLKLGDDMAITWEVRGAPKNHNRLVQRLFADPAIKEFRY